MSAPKVKVLEIDCSFMGRRPIYPALLCDERGCVLVDCGYPGFLPLLERASAVAGVEFGEINCVVITHPDYDHSGALHEIKEKYPHIRAMSSEFDAPYIEGTQPSLRVSMGMEKFASLPDDIRKRAGRFRERQESVKPVRIDRVLRGGDVMPWCGGTEIIPTPGHMPGHISLHVVPLKTLIIGDALIAARGKLRMSHPRYATHPKEAERTAAALLTMDVEKYVCYHGGTVTREPGGELRFGNGS